LGRACRYISYIMVLIGTMSICATLHFVETPFAKTFTTAGWPKQLQPRPTVMLMLADILINAYKTINEGLEAKGKFVSGIAVRLKKYCRLGVDMHVWVVGCGSSALRE
jgi:hypothetical protein